MLDHCTFRVSWSAEDREYMGTCAEFPGLSHLDATKVAALRGIEQLVVFAVEDMRRNNEDVPAPIAERAFSGRFQARLPAELRRSLTLEAAKTGVSLNRLGATSYRRQPSPWASGSSRRMPHRPNPYSAAASISCSISARMRYFCIFPVTVIGNSLTNRT